MALRRYIIGSLVALAGLAAGAAWWGQSGSQEPAMTPSAAIATTPQSRLGVVLVEGSSCASECQGQHDRCRVQTKGSSVCDAERQRCLEVCLQRKKK